MKIYQLSQKPKQVEELLESFDSNSQEIISEAIYSGMIGIMELSKFMKIASEKSVKKFKELLSNDKKKEAWELVMQTIESQDEKDSD